MKWLELYGSVASMLLFGNAYNFKGKSVLFPMLRYSLCLWCLSGVPLREFPSLIYRDIGELCYLFDPTRLIVFFLSICLG